MTDVGCHVTKQDGGESERASLKFSLVFMVALCRVSSVGHMTDVGCHVTKQDGSESEKATHDRC